MSGPIGDCHSTFEPMCICTSPLSMWNVFDSQRIGPICDKIQLNRLVYRFRNLKQRLVRLRTICGRTFTSATIRSRTTRSQSIVFRKTKWYRDLEREKDIYFRILNILVESIQRRHPQQAPFDLRRSTCHNRFRIQFLEAWIICTLMEIQIDGEYK